MKRANIAKWYHGQLAARALHKMKKHTKQLTIKNAFKETEQKVEKKKVATYT